jgi:hypothetical protein
VGAEQTRRVDRAADVRARPQISLDYGFLLGRFVDRATLSRAHDIAKRCGVHPHDVLIANGWLSAGDYYRALAEACGLPFKSEVTGPDMAPPSPASGPRECLASGLLRERGGGSFVLAPDRVSPTYWRAFTRAGSRSPRPRPYAAPCCAISAIG